MQYLSPTLIAQQSQYLAPSAAEQVSSDNTQYASLEPCTQCTSHVGELIVQLNGKSEILFSKQRQAADRLKAPRTCLEGGFWKGLTVL